MQNNVRMLASNSPLQPLLQNFLKSEEDRDATLHIFLEIERISHFTLVQLTRP